MSGYAMPEGLGGYCISRSENVAYLPAVINPNEGNGAVGRLLDTLKRDHDVVIVPTVTSARLQGMLDRRDFALELHWVPEFGDHAQCMVWRSRDHNTAREDAQSSAGSSSTTSRITHE